MVKWLSTRVSKLINKEMTVFSTNNAGESGYSNTKKVDTLLHIQKLTQTWSKTSMQQLEVENSQINF